MQEGNIMHATALSGIKCIRISTFLALIAVTNFAVAGEWSASGKITYMDVWSEAIHFQLDGGTKGNFFNCAGNWAYRLPVGTATKHHVAALYLAFATNKTVKVYEVGCDSSVPIPVIASVNLVP